MAILCRVTRGGYNESIHLAYVVVVDSSGQVVFKSGDPAYITCARSVLKPFQAAAVLKSGAGDAAGFSEPELALMCASHNGEAAHRKTVRSMLKKLGFSSTLLECGRHAPYDRDTARDLVRKGRQPTLLHNNCSGKHTGMLALAAHLGVDPAGYVRPEHPVQKTILNLLQTYAGVQEIPLAVDGCSAPTPFLSLRMIASLYQRLAGGEDPELERLFKAMTAHPYLVGGRHRFDTAFITALGGRAVTKIGGEGIRGVGLRRPDGETLGMALKVLDGNQRCSPLATTTVLNHLDLLSQEETNQLSAFQVRERHNHRNILVGRIRATLEA